jgi:hypothetical protein
VVLPTPSTPPISRVLIPSSVNSATASRRSGMLNRDRVARGVQPCVLKNGVEQRLALHDATVEKFFDLLAVLRERSEPTTLRVCQAPTTCRGSRVLVDAHLSGAEQLTDEHLGEPRLTLQILPRLLDAPQLCHASFNSLSVTSAGSSSRAFLPSSMKTR